MMKYKGYSGVVTFDDEAMIFHGEVVGLRDVITFQATTTKGLMKEFKVSVDDYLDWCEELGQKPEKPYSGTLTFRPGSDLHAKLAIAAKSKGVAVNAYLTRIVERAVG
jgi:predicted HicB family RNase H-like nuclease